MFFASFFDPTLFGGLLSLLLIWSVGLRLELMKGSIYLLYTTLFLSVFASVLHTFIIGFLTYFPEPSWSLQQCGPGGLFYGMWPTAFALMVVETQVSPQSHRPFMCCPFSVATKYYPLLLVLSFEIFQGLSGTIRTDLLMGVLAGYLYVRFPKLQVSDSKIQAWENSPGWSWLTEKHFFIGISARVLSGEMNDRGADVEAGQRQQRTSTNFGSGVSGRATGSSGGAAASNSVFQQGSGHRLGSSSSSSTRAARPGAVLADRLARSSGAPPASSRPSPSAPTASSYRDESPSEFAAVPWNPNGGAAASGGSVVSESDINKLEELGYTYEDARHALQVNNGDLQRAVQFLSGN